MGDKTFEWRDDFSVGIASIDAQHKKLVGMVAALQTAMQAGKPDKALADILSGLINYTVEHFSFEETLFDTHEYPKAAAHKAEHKDLCDKVVALQKDFKAGKAALSVEVMFFLTKWLTTHILGSDKSYAPFLIDCDVT